MTTLAAAMPRRAGRPRHTGRTQRVAPREEILQAAAELFVTKGFAATSTREIADQVGIRQASLYYHFAGKDEIVEELLRMTVRPTLDQLERIEDLAVEHGWAAALYVLVMVDTKVLADAPHNIGRLAYLPDVSVLEVFKPYKAFLNTLTAAYQRIGRHVAGLDINGIRLMHGTEVIIKHRIDGDPVDLRARQGVAEAALRHCGADQDAIRYAAAVSWADLME